MLGAARLLLIFPPAISWVELILLLRRATRTTSTPRSNLLSVTVPAAIQLVARSARGLLPTAVQAGPSWRVPRAVRSGIAKTTEAIIPRTGTTREWQSTQTT